MRSVHAQTGPALSNRCEGLGWSWPVDLGQVDPGNTEERGADIE